MSPTKLRTPNKARAPHLKWSEIEEGIDDEALDVPVSIRDRKVSLPNKLSKRKQSDMANHNYPSVVQESPNIRK